MLAATIVTILVTFGCKFVTFGSVTIKKYPLRLCLHRLDWGGLLFSLLRVEGGAVWRGVRCGGSVWLCVARFISWQW